MSELLVVGSKVKAYVKAQGCHSSGELLEGLNAKVQALIDDAAARCKANKRSTVKTTDL